jgi:hypothetical protein
VACQLNYQSPTKRLLSYWNADHTELQLCDYGVQLTDSTINDPCSYQILHSEELNTTALWLLSLLALVVATLAARQFRPAALH